MVFSFLPPVGGLPSFCPVPSLTLGQAPLALPLSPSASFLLRGFASVTAVSCACSRMAFLSVFLTLLLWLDFLTVSALLPCLCFPFSLPPAPPALPLPLALLRAYPPGLNKHPVVENYVFSNSALVALVVACRNPTSQAPCLLCTLLRMDDRPADRGPRAQSRETQAPVDMPFPPHSRPVPQS